jgi:hypothetical protein
MKKHLLIPVIALLPWTAQAAVSVYLEPRVSHVLYSGDPRLENDHGVVIESDLPNAVGTLVAGVEITPHVGIELRYSMLDDLRVRRIYPSWSWGIGLPGDPIIASPDVLSIVPWWYPEYEHHQKSTLFSLGVPIKIARLDKLSVSFTPLLTQEESEVTISQMPWPYDVIIAGQKIVIRREKETSLHAGAELSVNIQVHEHLSVNASYTYSSLETFDASFASIGLRVKF